MEQEFENISLNDLVEMRRELDKNVETAWREYQTLLERKNRLQALIRKECKHDWDRQTSISYGGNYMTCHTCGTSSWS
jgi:hypothetical protein